MLRLVTRLANLIQTGCCLCCCSASLTKPRRGRRGCATCLTEPRRGGRGCATCLTETRRSGRGCTTRLTDRCPCASTTGGEPRQRSTCFRDSLFELLGFGLQNESQLEITGHFQSPSRLFQAAA